MTFQPGSVVGDYLVEAQLGKGGMGQVYKVRNTISGRIEAMKVLLPNLSMEADLADRFLREIRVQASLTHPNIVQMYSAVRAGNQLLMLMEYIEGETVESIARRVRLPVEYAVSYVSQALSALEYAHGQGVVHRDVKPANMILARDGAVKLMDFGIAKASADQRLTRTGMTLGSLYYMSPEQIRGTEAIDGRSDLYSAGVVLYELATGSRPFDGGSEYSIMAAHLDQTPRPPEALNPHLPAPLSEAILMALAKSPADRFQNAASFRKTLESIVQALAQKNSVTPAPARTLTEPAPVKRAGPRRILWMAAGAVAAAAAVIGVLEYGPAIGSHAAKPAPYAAAPGPAAEKSPPPAATPSPTASPAGNGTSAPPGGDSQPQAQTPAPPAPAGAKAEPSQSAGALVVPSGRKGAKANPTAQPQASAPSGAIASHTPAAAPAPPPAQPPATTGQAAAAPNADADALRAASAQFDQLQGRAVAVGAVVDSLKTSLAAQGLSLRPDISEAFTLMNTYMNSAGEAIKGGNATAARTSMSRAADQVDKLEKIVGRH